MSRLTLFDTPEDDEYDGFFTEDDSEDPLVSLIIEQMDLPITEINSSDKGGKKVTFELKAEEPFRKEFHRDALKQVAVVEESEEDEVFEESIRRGFENGSNHSMPHSGNSNPTAKFSSPSSKNHTDKSREKMGSSTSQMSNSAKGKKDFNSSMQSLNKHSPRKSQNMPMSSSMRDNQGEPTDLQDTINFLLEQLKEEKAKKMPDHNTPALRKEIISLITALAESEAARKTLTDHLNDLKLQTDAKIKAATQDARKKDAAKIKGLEGKVEELKVELQNCKLEIEKLKKTSEPSIKSPKKQHPSSTALLKSEKSKISSPEKSDDELPWHLDSEQKFEYTPQKPKYVEGLEFLSPETLVDSKRKVEEGVKEMQKSQNSVKAPESYQNIPVKKTQEKPLNEAEELEKLKQENKKLHEHLRKMLNGRPSNLSPITSPRKSLSPLTTSHKKQAIDLESVSKTIVEVNPALNIIPINDSTIEVNKKRLSLMYNSNKVSVKIKDQLVDLKEYIKAHFPKESNRLTLSGSKIQ